MPNASSEDLRPQTGARYRFLRQEPPGGDASDKERSEAGLRYELTVFLADGRVWTGLLDWPSGAARLRPDPRVFPALEGSEGSPKASAGDADAGDTSQAALPDNELQHSLDTANKLVRVLSREVKERGEMAKGRMIWWRP